MARGLAQFKHVQSRWVKELKEVWEDAETFGMQDQWKQTSKGFQDVSYGTIHRQAPSAL